MAGPPIPTPATTRGLPPPPPRGSDPDEPLRNVTHDRLVKCEHGRYVSRPPSWPGPVCGCKPAEPTVALTATPIDHQLLVAVGVGRDHPMYEEAVSRVQRQPGYREALGRAIVAGLVEPVGLRLTVAGREAAYKERRAK